MALETFERLRSLPEFHALRVASANLGADAAQVQGPGGNTSLKGDGAMWVKASGAWLAEALQRDVMVPIRQGALRAAVLKGETPEIADYVPDGVSAPNLRPSIETTVHAAFEAPVVIHTHCVATIAVAIRDDAAKIVRQRIGDLDPIVVPYLKPGLPLAQALARQASPERRVAVLGNHGLIVTGETVTDAASLLHEVSRRLAGSNPTPFEPAELPAVQNAKLSVGDWRPAGHPAAHRVAREPDLLTLALAGPFYPDHVIFLGALPAVADPHEDADSAAQRFERATGTKPALVLVPGVGVSIRRDAPAAADAMARCLGDVLARVEPAAPVRPIPPEEVAELLDWDAEQYRQAMNARPSAS